MAEKPTVTVGPWPKGIDNRSPDYAVAPDALRNAVDVDLLQDGRVRRRKGYARVVSAVDPHSLYSCPAGTFFAAQGTLYRLSADNTTTAVLTGLAGRPVAYEYFSGDVYLSDGIVTKKLVGGITEALWGVPTPSSAPLLAATSGALAAGSFVGAVSFVSASGEESGVSPLASLTTSAVGGVRFSSLPSPASAEITAIRIYLSTPGGSVLYHVGDAAIGTTSYTVSVLTDTGKEADLGVYSIPLPCSIIKQRYGRMYCVSGSIVWYTEPFALGRVKLNSAFWQFPSPVTLLESVESGLFIAADKTYFYRFKNPDDVQVEELFEYGAISNTAVRMPHDDGIMWQSTRGAIMGTEDGKAKNVQEPLVATGDAASGAALLRELDGLRQFISVLSDAQTNALTASDFMEAEVIRKGA